MKLYLFLVAHFHPYIFIIFVITFKILFCYIKIMFCSLKFTITFPIFDTTMFVVLTYATNNAAFQYFSPYIFIFLIFILKSYFPQHNRSSIFFLNFIFFPNVLYKHHMSLQYYIMLPYNNNPHNSKVLQIFLHHFIFENTSNLIYFLFIY